MLNTGIFPDELKIANVIPLKNIFTQLSTYFIENKLIFDNQYGFRPKHST